MSVPVWPEYSIENVVSNATAGQTTGEYIAKTRHPTHDTEESYTTIKVPYTLADDRGWPGKDQELEALIANAFEECHREIDCA